MAKSKTPAQKPPTKSEVFRLISEKTDVPRKDVAAVFEELSGLIAKNLKKTGPQQFTLPGLCKIVVKRNPARPAQKNVWVPLLKEYRDIPAKPARNVVKVRPLKALKDMA